ncbi:MAG: DUF1501 domain-containing protein [Phaeodactylibacter sp.]|nr:DUF1501 domain-containing protein [Phaeodactylibacter sp.]
MVGTQSSADYLFEQSKTYRSRAPYPLTPFGQDFKTVAELITAETATQVYSVNLTGFDTHANQKNRQARLLKQLAEGLQAFVTDLQQNGLLVEVGGQR